MLHKNVNSEIKTFRAKWNKNDEKVKLTSSQLDVSFLRYRICDITFSCEKCNMNVLLDLPIIILSALTSVIVFSTLW